MVFIRSIIDEIIFIRNGINNICINSFNKIYIVLEKQNFRFSHFSVNVIISAKCIIKFQIILFCHMIF